MNILKSAGSQINKLFFAAGLSLFFLPLLALEITHGGKPAATIVLPVSPAIPEELAASQLRYWVKELTGAELPISDKAGDGVNIYIGSKFAEDKFAADVKSLKDSEGFAIRQTDNNLYIFGGKPVGTIFGCYDLLEKNTDIIWPTLIKDLDRVFTPVPTLNITKVNYIEKPVIAERAWGMAAEGNYYYNHPRSEYFSLRLKTNACNGSAAPRKRFGFSEDDYHCHNLHTYLPKDKYFEKNPEYFCLIDGKRVYPGYNANLCFTNKEGAEEFAKNFIRDRIENDMECRIAGIGVEDSNSTCNCPECLKPITLSDGTVITKEKNEVAFRSAQYYAWLNRIAKVVKQKYPDFKISTIAYMFTMEPPPIPIEDNIVVVYCPIGKNLKQDFSGVSNKKELERLKRWNELSEQFAIYEYWGCAVRYPRPVSYVIQKDLQVMRNMKIFRIYSEWAPSKGGEFVSAMEFWVTCKLLWNPDMDIEALRNEFLSKTFRAAAPEMKKFYDIVRDTWYADGAPSYYYDNPIKFVGYYLLKDEATEKACRDALNAAVEKADHPVSKELAKKIRDVFETQAAEAKKMMVKTKSVTLPKVTDASLATVEGSAWGEALEITDFNPLFNPKGEPKNPASVRVAYDGKNLWLKFSAKGVAFPLKSEKVMWSSEHWEIFIQGDRSDAAVPYFHLAFDTDGKKYNAIAYGTKWDIDWNVSIRKNDDSWDAVACIPLDKLNIKDNSMRMHFLRMDKGNNENVTWRGAYLHEPASFTEATLGK